MDRADGHVLSTDLNPFPATAVARAAEFDSEVVTIPTPAIVAAREHIDRYLSARSGADEGTVMAVVGDYGFGKTHLAGDLLIRARRAPNTRTMYLDAPAGFLNAAPSTFVALYRRFVEQLDPSDVNERVREYYADIVADALADSPPTEDVADRLRSGDLDPQFVVDRLGLMESTFLQQLQGQLRSVTDKEEFATALTLLLRPGFESAVWEWLRGYGPDQILVERGIRSAIDSEASALAAMGVFALLYGRRNHRLVLVIDELEKLLTGAGREAEDVAAFRTLLNVCAAAGTFLVLGGLRDFIEVLGSDAQERISRVIYMSKLGGQDAAQYIRESQQRRLQVAQLYPFSQDTVDYLVQLADGTPRKIVLLCHYVYRRAAEVNSQVTEAMVREIARTHVGVANIEDVRATVERVLRSQGLDYRRDYVVGGSRDSTADYWISVDDENAGFAILLADSVLTPEDAASLQRRYTTIKLLPLVGDVLLVISGYLPTGRAEELRDGLDTVLLSAIQRSFEEDLATAVKSAVEAREVDVSPGALALVRERIERVNRQQAFTHSSIDQLAMHIDELRAATEVQYTAIQRAVEDVSRAVENRGEGDAAGVRPTRLPPQVEQLFAGAAKVFDGLYRFDNLLRAAFPVQPADEPVAHHQRSVIQTQLRSEESFVAVGVAVLWQQLVDAFRQAIEEWYDTKRVDPHGQLDPRDSAVLDTLCRTFDSIYEYLPLARLNALARWTRRRTAHDDDMQRQYLLNRQADLRQTLDGFSARVRTAMREAIVIPG
jgi:hypothetical protein